MDVLGGKKGVCLRNVTIQNWVVFIVSSGLLFMGAASVAQAQEVTYWCGLTSCCYEESGDLAEGSARTIRVRSYRDKLFVGQADVSGSLPEAEINTDGQENPQRPYELLNYKDEYGDHGNLAFWVEKDGGRLTGPTRCSDVEEEETWLSSNHPFYREDVETNADPLPTVSERNLLADARISMSSRQFHQEVIATSSTDYIDSFFSELFEIVTEVAISRAHRRGEEMFLDAIQSSICSDKVGSTKEPVLPNTCRLLRQTPLFSLAGAPHNLTTTLSQDLVSVAMRPLNGSGEWEQIFQSLLWALFSESSPELSVLAMQSAANQLMISVNETFENLDAESCPEATLAVVIADCSYQMENGAGCDAFTTLENVMNTNDHLSPRLQEFKKHCSEKVYDNLHVLDSTIHYYMLLKRWASTGEFAVFSDPHGSRQKVVELAIHLVDLARYLSAAEDENEEFLAALSVLKDGLRLYQDGNNLPTLVAHFIGHEILGADGNCHRNGSSDSMTRQDCRVSLRALRVLNEFMAYGTSFQASHDGHLNDEEKAALRAQREQVIHSLMDHAAERSQRREVGANIFSLGLGLGISARGHWVSSASTESENNSAELGVVPSLVAGVNLQWNFNRYLGLHVGATFLNLGNYLQASYNEFSASPIWSSSLVAGVQGGVLLGGMSGGALLAVDFQTSPRLMQDEDGDFESLHSIGLSLSYYLPVLDFN